ncbi:MAG: hypothetical protein BWY57_02354 [Betaproteobacteria bacterium ADurb.Bin341]|nr:MAG: hypothetical protein BWY57_02354 [Betaproteobacteria bacterium ADurb.Bin341]
MRDAEKSGLSPIIIFALFALTSAFVGAPDATARPPTIEPAEVNTRNIGSCETYDPNDPYNLHNGASANGLRPLGAIYAYVQSYQKAYLKDSKPSDYSVKYIGQPQNGVIKTVSDENGTRDLYIPNAGFTGKDRYVAEVILKGVKFRIAGYIRPSNDVMSDYDDLCHRLGLPGSAWRISAAADSSNQTVTKGGQTKGSGKIGF